MHQLETLWRGLDIDVRRASEIAAGPAEALDQSCPHRIGTDRKDDRYRAGRGFGCERCGGRSCNDQVHLAADQIFRESG